eukprot:1507130-Prymnesium_polylepis.1
MRDSRGWRSSTCRCDALTLRARACALSPRLQGEPLSFGDLSAWVGGLTGGLIVATLIAWTVYHKLYPQCARLAPAATLTPRAR